MQRLLILIVLGCAATPALAQDRSVGLTLGVGAQSKPTYFGADTATTSFAPSFSLDRLSVGPFDFGGGEADGIGFKGGFRFIGERSADDDAALDGLTTIDPALEVGGGLSYSYLPDGAAQNWGNYAFAEVRYGVIGHEAFVAEAGADLIYAPNPQLEFRAGPRLFGGDDDYAATYFGVSETDAATSGFDAFDAGGGLLSRGLRAGVTYDFNDAWGIEGTVTYEEFLEDAANSPIVRQGSSDQLSVSVTVTRALEFNF